MLSNTVGTVLEILSQLGRDDLATELEQEFTDLVIHLEETQDIIDDLERIIEGQD